MFALQGHGVSGTHWRFGNMPEIPFDSQFRIRKSRVTLSKLIEPCGLGRSYHCSKRREKKGNLLEEAT